ncbi:hypothetical protein L873DRAFT_1663707 [Choiromyces venosus 120613-1]|uniref:Uncharacterized protein n=1 Tax=Choiromyces venosus 120613-1 TaxID=1336337 RepID=A0A3N4K3G7_9PEZI|nr:hypothetical protein L873DRAFT_1663707 [Choiromyces venosus 120613-1]
MSSRNNSVSTTASYATNASSSTTATSISTRSSEDRNTILSDFNPTVVLYVPPRKSLLSPKNTIPIHDLTPYIKVLDRENLTNKRLRALHTMKPWEKDGDEGKQGLVSQRLGLVSGCWGLGESIEWMVPWDVMKPAKIKGGREEVEVWCGKEDRRAQLFDVGSARYVWRFNEDSDQVLLEKHMMDTRSRHYIGAFYIKTTPFAALGPLTSIGGTLILDEKGLDKPTAVASVLILLKRERQRRRVGGGTI